MSFMYRQKIKDQDICWYLKCTVSGLSNNYRSCLLMLIVISMTFNFIIVFLLPHFLPRDGSRTYFALTWLQPSIFVIPHTVTVR